MYMCMWGCLDKYIRVATWLFQTKIPRSVPGCHNLTTFALRPQKLIECDLFLFSNTAVFIMILFCVIIFRSVGTNFAWNDVPQHTDNTLQQPHPYGMWLLLRSLFSSALQTLISRFSPYQTLWTFGPLPFLSRNIFILWVAFIISTLLHTYLHNYTCEKTKIMIWNYNF